MAVNKIAQIIPLTRLKRNMHYFDYLVPVQLSKRVKKGQLVEIPFKNKIIKGIIFNLSEKSPEHKYKLKEILAIIDPLPFLFSWQMKLIESLAKYYFISMTVFAKIMIAEVPQVKRTSKGHKFQNINFISEPKKKINVEQYLKNKKPVLLRYYDDLNKTAVYLSFIKKIVEKDEQILIIVPQINDIEKIYQYLAEYKDKCSVFLNNLSKNEHWQEWLKIKKGQANIIIGTRSAIFAPFKNLNTIIIDQEDNENHKQEEPNPRYNVKKVAMQIKELTNCKVIFTANTPSLESLYQVQKKYWQYYEIDKKLSNVNVRLIDKQDEFKKRNFSVLSDYLLEKIEYNTKRAQKIFLFINRKGLATLVSCTDCGFIASCPTCKLPLTLHKEKVLKCHHCDYKQDLFLYCPKCRGTNIKMQGTGIEKVEMEIRKRLPLVKILKIDIDSSPSEKNIMDNDIIIGTQYAFEYIDWQQIEMIGLINADTLFYLPDYKSMEKTFNLIMKLAYLLNSKKELIVQSFSVDNYILQAIRNLDYKKYYISELKERQCFSYPPVGKLIRLIYQSIEFNAGEIEINTLYNKLKKEKESEPNIVINPPILAYTQQVRGRWRWQIIIKILNKETDLSFLSDLPENIIIDVNPESLL